MRPLKATIPLCMNYTIDLNGDVFKTSHKYEDGRKLKVDRYGRVRLSSLGETTRYTVRELMISVGFRTERIILGSDAHVRYPKKHRKTTNYHQVTLGSHYYITFNHNNEFMNIYLLRGNRLVKLADYYGYIINTSHGKMFVDKREIVAYTLINSGYSRMRFNFRVESKGVVYIFTLDELGNVFTDNESGIPKAIPDRFGNVTVFNDGNYIVFNVRRNLDIVIYDKKEDFVLIETFKRGEK